MRKLMIKNKIVRNIIGAFSFVIVFILLLEIASFVFVPKGNGAKSGLPFYSSTGYYDEPLDSIDVIILGNSDAYCGVSPMEMWNIYGITSYNCGAPLLRMSDIYYRLVDVIKYQIPQVVVIEADAFFSIGTRRQDFENTLCAYFDYVFPAFEYHDRWKMLGLKDFTSEPLYNTHISEKGYLFSNGVQAYVGKKDYMAYTENEENIAATALLYFEQIYNLCKENDIQIVMLGIPSPTSWNYARHVAVDNLANDYGIKFLDLNTNYADIGIDLSTDTRDGGRHFNHNGAVKVSAYLGSYLNSNYALPDYRNDEDYNQWNLDYTTYYNDIKNNLQSKVNITK